MSWLSGVFQKENVQPCVLACPAGKQASKPICGERREKNLHKDDMQAQTQTQIARHRKKKKKEKRKKKKEKKKRNNKCKDNSETGNPNEECAIERVKGIREERKRKRSN